MTKPIRLTEYAHGGGCGCKISPSLLETILRDVPLPLPNPKLLVGNESADDAAVYLLNDEQALIATTDFFTPIVDDPFDFGRIAATNALSDIYAMGGEPILALANWQSAISWLNVFGLFLAASKFCVGILAQAPKTKVEKSRLKINFILILDFFITNRDALTSKTLFTGIFTPLHQAIFI